MNFLLEWTAVQRDVKIPLDLERASLQINTDSTVGGNEQIKLQMWNKDSSLISTLYVMFSSPMKYWIDNCHNDWQEMTATPGGGGYIYRIWTITKTEPALIITCNNVEVANYLFADSSNDDCVPKLAKDVEQVSFDDPHDSASDFYRAGISRHVG